MPKFLSILFLVLFSFSAFAQETTSSNGPIPDLNLARNHVQYTILDNPASIGYGHSSINFTTLSMPIPAGTPFTLLTPWTPPGSTFAASMAKGPTGLYYIITIEPALYDFNPGTGAVTLLGSITGMGGDQPNGIKFNPANGLFYIAGSTSLYSINVSTRVATLIGSFNVSGSLMIDLCFNAGGVCYAYDLVTDAAYTVNISTGAATLLGPLGYDANFGQGMSYDYETSTIYLSAFNNGTFTGQLRTMDPATGNTTLITDWGFDQVAPFHLDTQMIIPVELTSFSANVNEGNVILNWSTATETNNQGFEVQRSLNGEFVTVGFVQGNGTTTETKTYSYIDKNINDGSYSYRLKQVDFDGTFEYSNVVEVEILAPAEFNLAQNYPNPFNPSTMIAFNLAVDSKVSLNIFNVLGQEVATLINTNLVAGSHQVNFDASSLNTGVYMYRIEAAGIDGTNFVDVKKMILTK